MFRLPRPGRERMRLLRQPAHIAAFDPFAPAPSGEHMIALEPRILLDAAGGEAAGDALESRRPVIDLDGPADGSGLDSRSVEIDYPDGAVSVRLAEADAAVLDRTDDIVRLTIVVTGDRQGGDDAVLIGDQVVNLGRSAAYEGVAVGGSQVDIAYDAPSGTFAITSAGGDGAIIPKADLQALVRGLEYGNLALQAREADLIFQLTALDAAGHESDPVSASVSIASSGATPVAILDPDGSSSIDGRYRPTFTENGAPVPIADVDVAIQDRDGSNIDEVIITLSNPQTGDALEVSLPDDLEGIGSFQEQLADGRLRVTLYSSSESTANNYDDIARALRSVTFTSTSERPDTTPRLVSVILIDDTGTQGTPTRLRIDVASVNDRPALDLDRSNRTDNGPDYRTQYTENAPGVAIISVGDNLLVDLDDPDLQRAEAAIDNPEAGDRLFVAPGADLPPDLLVSVAADGLSVAITGEGTPQEYARALEALRFESQGETPVPGDRRVEMRIHDGRNHSNTGTAFVRVFAVNDPPVVIDPRNPENPDGPSDPSAVIPSQDGTDAVALTPLETAAYFRDPDGDALTYALENAPPWMAIDPATGTITGTPPRDASQTGNTDQPGLYAVRVVASDGEAAVGTTALFRIVNPAPEARPDRDGALDDGPPVTGSVLLDNGDGPDRDPDGDALGVAAVNGRAGALGAPVAGSAGGTFTVTADAGYTFDPGTDFVGLREGETRATAIRYTLSDGEGGTDETTLTVVVTGRNQGPDARDDALATDEDTAIAADLLADNGAGPDSDPEADPLAVTHLNGVPLVSGPGGSGEAVRLPSGAVVTLAADGTARYDPAEAFQPLAPGEGATDAFTYTIADPGGLTSTATVSVRVEGRNDAPIPLDPGQPPVADPHGPDAPPTDPDDPREPPADPDDYIPAREYRDGEAIEPFALAPWFGDPDRGDTLTITVGPGLPEGLRFDPATGTITGTPARDASQGGQGGDGVYRVAVTATDPSGASFTTTLTLQVLNPAPQATDDGVSTNADETVGGEALANDRDPDGDTLAVAAVNGEAAAVGTVVPGSAGGTFRVEADGTVLFDPAGDFDALRGDETAITTITYTVSDGEGGAATATITATVTAGNALPELAGPVEVQTGLDAAPVAVLDMGARVGDPDGDALAYALAPGAPDWLAIDAVTGEITGTPPRDASAGGPGSDGRYPVTVRVSDGEHVLDVPVEWRIANPAPLATDDALTLAEGTGEVVRLRDNDRDPDGDDLRVTHLDGQTLAPGAVVTTAGGLELTVSATGVRVDASGLPVVLGEGETFTEAVPYTIRDAQGATAAATLTVTVMGVNDAPERDGAPPPRDGWDMEPIRPIAVAPHVADPNGDPLTYALGPDAPDWLAIDAATGEITGTPPADASAGGPGSGLEGDGRYPFTVTASDGRADVAVPVEVRIANPAPVAADDASRTDERRAVDVAVLANDADPDGDAHWVSAVDGRPIAMGETVTLADGTTVTMVAPGTLRFDPAGTMEMGGGETASVVFDYTITDAQGAESTATVTVRVDGVDGPVHRPVPPVELLVPGPPTPLLPLFAGDPILATAVEVIAPLAPRIDLDVTSPEPILTQANERIRRLGGDVSLFGAPSLTQALDRVADRDEADRRWQALTGETGRGLEFCAHMGPGHSALLRSHLRGDVVYLDLGTFGRERFASWRVEGSGHARVAMLDRNIAQIERPADATHEHLDVHARARDGTRYHLPLRIDLLSGEIQAAGPVGELRAAAVPTLREQATLGEQPTLREQIAAFDPSARLDAIFGPRTQTAAKPDASFGSRFEPAAQLDASLAPPLKRGRS